MLLEVEVFVCWIVVLHCLLFSIAGVIDGDIKNNKNKNNNND